MKDGTYTVYCIEHRWVATNRWLQDKTQEEGAKHLKPVEKIGDWAGSNWDSFGRAIDPCKWVGNSVTYKYPKLHDEVSKVRSLTSISGFFTEKYALEALTRLRKADDEGMFDSYDGYKHFNQAVRHEFRIIKLEISKKTTLVAEMRTKWTEGR